MTRTDALLFAINRAVECERKYIDGRDIRSVQIGVTLDKSGQAHVTIQGKTEHTVIDCYDGSKRLDRFLFATTT